MVERRRTADYLRVLLRHTDDELLDEIFEVAGSLDEIAEAIDVVTDQSGAKPSSPLQQMLLARLRVS